MKRCYEMKMKRPAVIRSWTQDTSGLSCQCFATTARQLTTLKIFYMYCTGGTECLSHTPGSHSVCAVRTQLESSICSTYGGLWGLVVVRLSWLSGRALAVEARGVLGSTSPGMCSGNNLWHFSFTLWKIGGRSGRPRRSPFYSKQDWRFLVRLWWRAIETCTESKRTYWTVMYMYKATIELELSFITWYVCDCHRTVVIAFVQIIRVWPNSRNFKCMVQLEVKK